MSHKLNLISFDQIVIKYLNQLGYEPVICETEDEARQSIEVLCKEGKWPCYFFNSDTTGEKDFEEFFSEDEIIDLDRFVNIGVIKSGLELEEKKLETFLLEIEEMKKNQLWRKKDLVALFNKIIPNFNHLETDKYLDDRM